MAEGPGDKRLVTVYLSSSYHCSAGLNVHRSLFVIGIPNGANI